MTDDKNVWRMGRVEETINGKDNRIHGAIIRTLHGQLGRPINKLVIIESSNDAVKEIDYNGIKFVKNAKEEIKQF